MGPVLLSMLCCVRMEGKEGQVPIGTGQQEKAALNTIHDAPHLRGWSQNITACKGGSVSFPQRRFNKSCEVGFLGKDKNEDNKKDVFYSHGPNSPDLPFDSYKGRLEIRTNCNSTLKNVQPEDEGWYCVTWDLLQNVYVYLRVTGVSQNLTAVTGDSDYLHGRLFTSSCEWEYEGGQKTNKNGKTIINVYVSNNQEFTQPFDPYAKHTELHLNCTLLLKNSQLEGKSKKEFHCYYPDNIGVSQNLTDVTGDSDYLPGRLFMSFCEWEYEGGQKTNKNEKTIINVYDSNNQEFTQPFDPYANHTELHLNCTLLLKNSQLEDNLKIDHEMEFHCYYPDNIGNGKSLIIWLGISCLVFLVIVGFCCYCKRQKLREIITGSRRYQRSRNPSGNGEELPMEQL